VREGVRIRRLKGFQISFEDPELVYLMSFEMNRQQTYRDRVLIILDELQGTWTRLHLFPPMRVFGMQWSRAISLVCEVALRDQVQSLERCATLHCVWVFSVTYYLELWNAMTSYKNVHFYQVQSLGHHTT
jgi:hypothetical protein